MLSLIRRGPIALRPLQSSPFRITTKYALSSSKWQPFVDRPLPVPSLTKHFSSYPNVLQQAALAESHAEDGPQEFTTFEELAQAGLISRAVIDTITNQMNIHDMTEVQKMTLNQCLDGEDVIAQARTGTGKTIAFLLPIIQRILRQNPDLESRARRTGSRGAIDIKGLIISPTRELAEQIAVEARRLTGNTGIKIQTAVGGTQKAYHLRSMQNEGCHLLIGTPGRVTDILQDPQSGVRLDGIQTFVLDEADRLLDIGFAPAIDEIQTYMPQQSRGNRQTLMFSATVPKSVVGLVRQTMRPNFKFVRTIDPDEAPTHERIPQKVVFLRGLQNQAPAILEIATRAIEAHKQDPVNNMPFKAIVYFSSTNEVDMAYTIFENMRDPSNAVGRGRFAPHPLEPTKLFRMNGKLDQRVRTRESSGFRQAESAILFSSDVTARGMDFPNVSHVIQIGLPRSADDYVHRIGRTGRAGKSGEGWLLLNQDEQRAYVKKMSHPGLKLEEAELPTAALDMTKPAQIASNIAKLLQTVETGVKNVPYNIKRSVYQSLLGVLPQQFPDRQRQEQINMMNDLARYGWGMQTPPPLPTALVRKLGYEHCRGIEFEPELGRSSSTRQPRSGPSRRNNAFDDSDPFGMGQSGKGVFGGSMRDNDNDGNSRGYDRGNRSRSFGGEKSYGGSRRGNSGSRGGFGSQRGRDDFSS